MQKYRFHVCLWVWKRIKWVLKCIFRNTVLCKTVPIIVITSSSLTLASSRDLLAFFPSRGNCVSHRHIYSGHLFSTSSLTVSLLSVDHRAMIIGSPWFGCDSMDQAFISPRETPPRGYWRNGSQLPWYVIDNNLKSRRRETLRWHIHVRFQPSKCLSILCINRRIFVGCSIKPLSLRTQRFRVPSLT